MRAAPHVAVIGPNEADREIESLAEGVGAELAGRGAVIVCGGLGGAMEAACRGARSAGGHTIGLLPGLDRREANEFVEVAVATGLGELRNLLVVRASDAVVAVGGELGTLSEIALAAKAGKTVVGLRTWQLAKAGAPVAAYLEAETPAEAADLALGAGP